MARHQIAPAWQTQRGALVQAHGCAAGVPVAGVKVYGNTTQNLWVNPVGTIGGVTVTPTDDGALTLSGTASKFVSINAETFALKPSTSYTISVDKEPGTIATAILNVMEKRSDGSYINPQHNASTGGVTFTTSADMASCECRLVVISGTTVSGTHRVMINEGPTAQPWCPPGLSSVGELGVASAGKNLLSESLEGKSPGTTLGTPYLLVDFGHDVQLDAVLTAYTDGLEIHGATNSAFYDLRKSDGTHQYVIVAEILSTSVGPVADGAHSKDVSDYVFRYVYCYFLGVGSGYGQFTGGVEIQLELGSTPTAYEPPAVTTPIALSGHQLRSLPDGTRDVLTVDGSGAVVVEQATAEIVLDGSQTIQKQVPDTDRYDYFIMPELPVMGLNANDDSTMRCDRLPVAKNRSDISPAGKYGVSHGYSDENYIYFNVPAEENTIESVKAWLAAHPVTVVYQIKNQQTVPLDPIAPPPIPAADAALWAASDVPCDIEATTWTASGAEQGRQQAAMVKVAQQVRQQAETVAALTTQALEA